MHLLSFLMLFNLAFIPVELPNVSPLVDPPATVSHEMWNTLLQKHVSPTGEVDYASLQKEKASLMAYTQSLSKLPPQASWTQDQTLAYWINAYNAYTIQLILEHHPIKSIKDLDKPWDTPFIKIGGKSYSLNDIEHKVIRVQFKEPRIHFALNCASVSCPKLLNEAYNAEKLAAQLTKQTRLYINNPQHNQLAKDKITISSLFDWYKEDFTKSSSLIEFLNKYADQKIAPNAKISYKSYNWDLNGLGSTSKL